MAKKSFKKTKKNSSLTVESIRFALDTLGLSAEDLLDKLHFVDKMTLEECEEDYTNWVCKQIQINAENEDNMPLSQFKLKWASLLAEAAGGYDKSSNVSPEVEHKIDELLESSELGFSKDGYFKISIDGFESIAEEAEEDFEWDGEQESWFDEEGGLVENALESAFDTEWEEDRIVFYSWLKENKTKPTPLKKCVEGETTVKNPSSGEQRLHQFVRTVRLLSPEERERIFLVVHNDYNFWNGVSEEIMSEFLDCFELLGVIDDVTARELFKAAPSEKNQVITVWHGLREDIESQDQAISIQSKETVFYRNNKASRIWLLELKEYMDQDPQTGRILRKGLWKGSIQEELLAYKGLSEAQIRCGTGYGFVKPPVNSTEAWGMLVITGCVGVKLEDEERFVTGIEKCIEKYSKNISVEARQILDGVTEERVVKTYLNHVLKEYKRICGDL